MVIVELVKFHMLKRNWLWITIGICRWCSIHSHLPVYFMIGHSCQYQNELLRVHLYASCGKGARHSHVSLLFCCYFKFFHRFRWPSELASLWHHQVSDYSWHRNPTSLVPARMVACITTTGAAGNNRWIRIWDGSNICAHFNNNYH